MTKPELDLSDEHWLIVKNILATYLANEEIWAFGSRARFTAKPFSDLDLVVLNNEPLATRTCAQLAEAFAESDLPWKVDLVQWRDLSPEFQQRIKEHRVVVHKPCHTQAYCRGGL